MYYRGAAAAIVVYDVTNKVWCVLFGTFVFRNYHARLYLIGLVYWCEIMG